MERDEVDIVQRALPSTERFVDGVRTHSHAERFRAQESGTAEYLVAWADSEPVAYALVRWEGPADEWMRERGVRGPYVEGLSVRSDLWSHGIGTAIMLEAEQRTAARGYAHIGLAVGRDNERARRLYERLGYRESGLGDFDVSWTFIDSAGNEGIEGEMCTYLVKSLTEARSSGSEERNA
jgi:GNAT superfamily N-acetyltransferase